MTRQFNRHLFAFGVFSLVLGLQAPARAGTAPRSFHVETLSIDGKLLDACLLPAAGTAPATLICISTKKEGGRHLRHITPFGIPGFEKGEVFPVPAKAVMVQIADVLPSPGSEIVYLQPDGITAQARQGGRFTPTVTVLLPVRTFFDHPQGDALPSFPFCRDFTGDGKADLLVPQHHGYLLAVQEKEGFPRMFPLEVQGKNRMIRMAHEIFKIDFMSQNCSLPALLAGDFNGDGRLDLMGLREKTFIVFLGKGAEGFPLKPTYQVALPCLATSVDEPEEDVFEGKRVYVEEINGDGLVDLIAVRTQGKIGLFSSIRTRFELFLGRKGAFFPRFPDRILTVPGVGTLPEFFDLEGDGKKELVVPALRTDILSGVKTAATQEVTITYFLFAVGADGLWETSPAFRESTGLAVGRIEKGQSVPAAAFGGDFDGDGRRDRLAFKGETVQIHPGIPDSRYRFSEEPRWTFQAQVSNDFEVEEINGDGFSDILFFHTDKVVVVLSQP
ncbi:MAG: FG-GAP repeat domain-containing protein [Planctomycetota bacterium]|jgi:hypothetical protein